MSRKFSINPDGILISDQERRLLKQAIKNQAIRSCLKCEIKFISVGYQNRLCDTCTNHVQSRPFSALQEGLPDLGY